MRVVVALQTREVAVERGPWVFAAAAWLILGPLSLKPYHLPQHNFEAQSGYELEENATIMILLVLCSQGIHLHSRSPR